MPNATSFAPRTDAEILARIETIRRGDVFGFEWPYLSSRLTFEVAKRFLQDTTTTDDWGTGASRDLQVVLREMREYMAFAWTKVQDHRGISAVRSVAHFRAWLWLIGDEELLAFASDSANHTQYGAPILKAIAEKYDFPVPADEAIARMARGELCADDCQEGCEP